MPEGVFLVGRHQMVVAAVRFDGSGRGACFARRAMPAIGLSLASAAPTGAQQHVLRSIATTERSRLFTYQWLVGGVKVGIKPTVGFVQSVFK